MTITSTMVQAQARIAELEAQLAQKQAAPALTVKVSVKGAVSVYGLGRWPVTLYKSQWERLISEGAPKITVFMASHKHELANKPDGTGMGSATP